MKHIFLLAVALVMTCTFAFAQTQSPYSKGKYFGKKLIQTAVEGDEAASDRLDDEVEAYIDNNVETEEDLENFLNGLEAGIRQGCNDYGLGDEIADMILEELAMALLAELGYY